MTNRVYNEFVDEESDLVGMIAYSIYKGEKITKIEEGKENQKSTEAVDKLILEFSEEAIKQKQLYFDKAFDIVSNFAEAYFKEVVDEEARATLLAENRRRAMLLHLILTFVWGVAIIIGFYYLSVYIGEIKVSSIYKLGLSFKDNNELLLYLFERFSRRLFIIGAIFFAIKIVWHNFQLSFNNFNTNMHYSDNLRIFDYLKSQTEDKETLIKELSKYIFMESNTIIKDEVKLDKKTIIESFLGKSNE